MPRLSDMPPLYALPAREEVMPIFHIWSEGYVVSGDSDCARCQASIEAETFRDACKMYYGGNKYFDAERLTYWGCRLFDNEQDARKAYG